MRYITLLSLLTCFSYQQTPKLSPEHKKALESLQVMEGFKVELVAAEPLIADPVAMEVDEDGNMYVVEMHGYPLDVSGSGKVKLLKDTDNDGFPDKSIVFADHLKLPTGIMRWEKGIIVTDAPDVLYLEDTNNDGKADIRKKMLSGFALSNPQHNLNTPRFELDNWIYLGHEGAVTPFVYKKEFGDKGTKIGFPDNPNAPQLDPNANGRAVRFKPDSYEVEELSGRTQYGHSMDAWGHHLYTSNANHLYHEVLGNQYLKNNPALLVPNATQNISDHGEAAEIYPITETPNHQLLTDVGVITSSCGVTWYLGGAFGEKFKNVTFIAEPVHNLVHADVIKDDGASFVASRLNEKSEFLASKDAWFRPVNFYVGPDGALYVIDYYRQIIEHPEWMSDEITQSGALYNGTDKGRIYRIVPEKGLPMNWLGKLNLSKKTSVELVKLLENENGWYRRTAQRLLLHRQAKESIPALRELISKSKSPEAKVHALWLLDAMKSLGNDEFVYAFGSSEAGVRENAIRVAERHLNGNFKESLEKELLALQNDESAKVRFQLLNTLGFLKSPEAEKARLVLLKRDFNDRWAGLAGIASFAGKENQIFDLAIREFTKKQTPETAEFFSNLAATIANGTDKTAVSEMMQKMTLETPNADGWKAATLNGIAKLWQFKKSPGLLSAVEKEQLLTYFSPETSPELRTASLNLLEVVGLPKGKVLDEKTEMASPEIEEKESEKEEMAVEENKAEMSLDSYLDLVYTLSLMEEETESRKEFLKEEDEFALKCAVEEIKKEGEKDFAIVSKGMFAKMKEMSAKMAKMEAENKAYMSEFESLKSFKKSADEARFSYEIESTLKEVEAVMPSEEFEKARSEATNFSLETVDAWKNAVKAKAFTFSKPETKKNKEEQVAPRWAFNVETNQTKESLWKK